IMAIAHDGLLELQSEILLEINKYDEYSEEQIHDAVCAYMEFALKNPERFVLMFKIMITDSRITFKKCPQLRKLAHQSFQALIDYIHEGQKRKIFDPGDPSFISLSLWSMIHGLSMMAVTDYLQNIGIKATWKKDVVNHLTNLLCNARQRR
ncbi:MAG: TetR-like C-terminal domain-containing protein, partial [Pseudomonadota bacterium]